MTSAPEQKDAATKVEPQTSMAENAAKAASASPAPSDKSSDSEGRPVREKLKETRIDAQTAFNAPPGSDQPTRNVTNGSPSSGDESNSGSESGRGRLRRKRSREDFEEEQHEADKQSDKNKPAHDRHARKKSRDITKDTESAVSTKSSSTPVERIDEDDVEMTSPNKPRNTSAKTSGADLSPKNKRTRDQVDKEAETNGEETKGIAANGKPVQSGGDERNSKRPRDEEDVKSTTETKDPIAKIPFGSGFSNTSASSPFAAMSPKPQASKIADKTEGLPQTSNEKFKSSGFGSFASSTASPFGLANSKPSSSSAFGASSGSKLSFSAGSTAAPTSTGGFPTMGKGSSTKPSFGGSAFGGSSFGASSGGFAGLGGARAGQSSFASPGGGLEITGLSSKPPKPFGAAGEDGASDDEDGDDSEAEGDETRSERRSSQPLLSQQPQETGEEGDTIIWTGRAKLYTMSGEPDARVWKERGTGQFRFNLTLDEPKKARFVLRADGTHRLLLNMLVTKNTTFGCDAEGSKPKDGRLVFNEPVNGGVIEMHLLKLKAENAIKLWEEVQSVQESEL